MGPDAHADESDADCGGYHYGIAEDCLAREDGDDLGCERECWNNQDINFGMAEHPKEVHPNYR